MRASTASSGRLIAGAPRIEEASLKIALPWSMPIGPGPGDDSVMKPSARRASSSCMARKLSRSSESSPVGFQRHMGAVLDAFEQSRRHLVGKPLAVLQHRPVHFVAVEVRPQCRRARVRGFVSFDGRIVASRHDLDARRASAATTKRSNCSLAAGSATGQPAVSRRIRRAGLCGAGRRESPP